MTGGDQPKEEEVGMQELKTSGRGADGAEQTNERQDAAGTVRVPTPPSRNETRLQRTVSGTCFSDT